MAAAPIALTGNIAAGKSTVAALFREWGATILDADAIVRELQQPGTPVFAAIVQAFGPEVVAADGTLDRAALRRRVFADDAARAQLNAIVHPAVFHRRAELAAAAEAAGARCIINDIPLLFEVADPASYPVIILVDAPEAERRRRLIEDRGLDPTQADALLRSQLPSGEKRTRSTYVIDNDADRTALVARARAVWDALQTAPTR